MHVQKKAKYNNKISKWSNRKIASLTYFYLNGIDNAVVVLRSAQAIDRMLALIALTYLYCVIGTGSYCLLGGLASKTRISYAKQNFPLQ
ncbi:hypothetical protein Ga0466249_002422 [Sporomusaceae bacterium BoRhaA]|uniref:hypothetical protein n=1 Tax=Pelorhabdus rhamnosifermentans TaxID=2772457 RepID=UPI001C062AE7|nr:hypothetical protein [Pelorhabdus rhamnosifermentans]MBU2701308.1 hypothetical protein [Pelorhabdus rhamnosifermentans]